MGHRRKSGYYKITEVEKAPHFITFNTEDGTSQKFFRIMNKCELKVENVVDKI